MKKIIVAALVAAVAVAFTGCQKEETPASALTALKGDADKAAKDAAKAGDAAAKEAAKKADAAKKAAADAAK